MAGSERETDNGIICGNALRTRISRKHLIKLSIKMWLPNNYMMSYVWCIVGVTRTYMTMFLSARSLDLYCETSEHAQDHFHPVIDQAPPSTRRCRLVLERCEGASWRDVSSVSRSSTLRGWFPSFSLVRLSQTATVAVLHCNLSDLFFMQVYKMAMSKESRSVFLVPLVPPWEVWGADRHSVDGDGHWLQQSVKHADWWRRASVRPLAIRIAN